MAEVMLGAVAAMLVLGALFYTFKVHNGGSLVRIIPQEDGHHHNSLECECLPQSFSSYGRVYEVHHDMRDTSAILIELA